MENLHMHQTHDEITTAKKKITNIFHLDARMRWSKEILSIVNDGTNDVVVGILRKQEKSDKINKNKEQHCIFRKTSKLYLIHLKFLSIKLPYIIVVKKNLKSGGNLAT